MVYRAKLVEDENAFALGLANRLHDSEPAIFLGELVLEDRILARQVVGRRKEI